MNSYSSTPNVLILVSLLTWGLLYFIGLAIPAQHDAIKLGYDTCFLVLALGYTLKQRKLQQLIALFFLIILYNLDLFKRRPFQLDPTSYFFYFATHYSFYIILISCVFFFPTLFEKYKLQPLTDEVNFKNSSVIVASLSLILIIQASARLI